MGHRPGVVGFWQLQLFVSRAVRVYGPDHSPAFFLFEYKLPMMVWSLACLVISARSVCTRVPSRAYHDLPVSLWGKLSLSMLRVSGVFRSAEAVWTRSHRVSADCV